MSEISIERLTRVTNRDYSDISSLLPQLTERAGISEEELRRAVDDIDTHIFVARDEGRIVGVGMMIIMHIFAERRGRIEDMVVDEACRGKGVGKQLMDFLIIAAKGKGLDAIELSSRPDRKAANALYTKFGFEQRKTNVYRLDL